MKRYERLELDIKKKGLIVDNCPLGVGANGMITARNSGGPKYTKIYISSRSAALSCLHIVWIGRNSQTFGGGSLIQ